MDTGTIQTILTLIGLAISGVGIVFFNKRNSEKLSLTFLERREADLTKVIILEQKTAAMEKQNARDSEEHAQIFNKLDSMNANITDLKLDIANKLGKIA